MTTPHFPHPILGSEVLRCRAKSQKQLYMDLGNGAMYYFGAPLALIVSCPLTGGVGMLFQRWGMKGTIWHEPVWGPLLIASWLLIVWIFIWLMYYEPNADFLTLHEHGLAFRIYSKRRVLSFSEIRSITAGYEYSGLTRMLMAPAKYLHPTAHQNAQAATRWALTFHMANGKTDPIPGFLIRFDSQDTLALLDRIRQQHPTLLNFVPA